MKAGSPNEHRSAHQLSPLAGPSHVATPHAAVHAVPNYKRYMELQALSRRLLKEINSPKKLMATVVVSGRNVGAGFADPAAGDEGTLLNSWMRPTAGNLAKQRSISHVAETFFNGDQSENQNVLKAIERQFSHIQKVYSPNGRNVTYVQMANKYTSQSYYVVKTAAESQQSKRVNPGRTPACHHSQVQVRLHREVFQVLDPAAEIAHLPEPDVQSPRRARHPRRHQAFLSFYPQSHRRAGGGPGGGPCSRAGKTAHHRRTRGNRSLGKTGTLRGPRKGRQEPRQASAV